MRPTRWFLVRVALSIFILFAASGPLYSASFSFAVLGDSQGDSHHDINVPVLSGLVSDVLETNAGFVFCTGDLVYGEFGTFLTATLAEQLTHWRDIMAPIYNANFYGAKVYAGPGNHEIKDAGSETVWQSVFGDLPANGPAGETYMTYSFDFLNAHFIMLDTERAGSPHTVNQTWLAADLAATEAKHIFVFGHEPAFPVGLHAGSSLNAFPDERDAFWNLLVQYHVDIYFCGHEHLYDHQEVDGVQQVIAGSAGAPYQAYGGDFYNYVLVTVDGAKVSVEIIDDQQTLRDHFEFARPVPLPAAAWLLGVGVLCLAGGRLIFPKRRYPPANISLIAPEGR